MCHGVGSAGLFKDYLESIEAKNGKKTTDFVFRDESLGWNRPSVRFEFEDGTTVKERWYKNRFIQAFSKNKILRSSCYECKYSSIPRISDVSIADFWGAKKIKAAFNKHGTSLVLVHSAKGEEILSAASAELVMREVNYQDAIKYNKSAVSSVKKPEMRDTLFYHLRTDGYKYVEKRYLYLLSVPQKIVRKLKNFL